MAPSAVLAGLLLVRINFYSGTPLNGHHWGIKFLPYKRVALSQGWINTKECIWDSAKWPYRGVASLLCSRVAFTLARVCSGCSVQ